MPVKPSSSLSRFVDVDRNFSNRRLLFSMWYLRHIDVFRRICVGVLLCFCVGTIGFSVWHIAHYLFVGYWQDRVLYAELSRSINYAAMQSSYTATPLVIRQTTVFSLGNELYDFSSLVRNENARYVATVSYHYESGGVSSPIRTVAVLPGQETILGEYGFSSSKALSSARLVLDSVAWKLVDPHRLSDVSSFISERIDFSVENVLFTPASPLEGIVAHQLSFDLVNNSVYGYVNPVFFVQFLDQDRVVGIYYLEFEDIGPLQRQFVDLRSFAADLFVTDVRIFPSIDVFDAQSFMSLDEVTN